MRCLAGGHDGTIGFSQVQLHQSAEGLTHVRCSILWVQLAHLHSVATEEDPASTLHLPLRCPSGPRALATLRQRDRRGLTNRMPLGPRKVIQQSHNAPQEQPHRRFVEHFTQVQVMHDRRHMPPYTSRLASNATPLTPGRHVRSRPLSETASPSPDYHSFQ